MKKVIILIILLPGILLAGTIHVPDDSPTIQDAINSAVNKDTILIAPGVYKENILLKHKTVTLASLFLNFKDITYIGQTVIDGNGETVLLIEGAGSETKIIGLTIRNGEDGISTDSNIQIVHNRFIQNEDGIDYENGSGLCQGNLFENNTDDGIDLDGACDVIIEDNIIRNNQDDGVEIRLHPYNGSVLNIIIRNNIISGNQEDGIQFIDYSTRTDRVFRIERNVITNNAMSAIGCMGKENTRENYESADIPEQIFIINNTFVRGNYGITGGDNMVVLNNVFAKIHEIAMKRVDGNSIAGYNLFWGNDTDLEKCNWQKGTTLFKDPALGSEYELMADSPCIDAGTSEFFWKSQKLLALPKECYIGSAPDLGAVEFKTSN